VSTNLLHNGTGDRRLVVLASFEVRSTMKVDEITEKPVTTVKKTVKKNGVSQYIEQND
jgi:hypothetical protein